MTIFEFTDNIGAGMDKALGENLLKILKKQGMHFKLRTQVTDLKEKDGLKILHSNDPTGNHKGTETHEFDAVLVSVGRRPYTENLNLNVIIKFL